MNVAWLLSQAAIADISGANVVMTTRECRMVADRIRHLEDECEEAKLKWVSVEDGFGNIWERCRPGCDMHVVRPGKVQCSCEEDEA